jgi:hypothetical protein
LVQLRQIPEEDNQSRELDEPICERSSGPSHVVGGGGATHRPLEVHRQNANCWLIREQLKTPQCESKFNIKRRQQKERLRDVKHYLNQEWRFAPILHQVQHMSPGRALDKAIEIFWISVYNGYYHPDHDVLQQRGWALAECLCLRDEIEEMTPQDGTERGTDP